MDDVPFCGTGIRIPIPPRPDLLNLGLLAGRIRLDAVATRRF